MTTTETTKRRVTAAPKAAGGRLWPALRAVLLRRACAAARGELKAIGDARLLAIGLNKGDLATAIEMFERKIVANIEADDRSRHACLHQQGMEQIS